MFLRALEGATVVVVGDKFVVAGAVPGVVLAVLLAGVVVVADGVVVTDVAGATCGTEFCKTYTSNLEILLVYSCDVIVYINSHDCCARDVGL